MKDLTAPNVSRTRYGTPIWPDDTRGAWYQLCDLARIAPDNYTMAVDEIVVRLRQHGEKTHRKTVERIVWASDKGWVTWRPLPT